MSPPPRRKRKKNKSVVESSDRREIKKDEEFHLINQNIEKDVQNNTLDEINSHFQRKQLKYDLDVDINKVSEHVIELEECCTTNRLNEFSSIETNTLSSLEAPPLDCSWSSNECDSYMTGKMIAASKTFEKDETLQPNTVTNECAKDHSSQWTSDFNVKQRENTPFSQNQGEEPSNSCNIKTNEEENSVEIIELNLCNLPNNSKIDIIDLVSDNDNSNDCTDSDRTLSFCESPESSQVF